MNLNNSQLTNYKDRIKFSKEDKQKYQTQIDHLISSIEAKILEHIDVRVTKVLQSGSWKKGTILKPKDDVPVDIDLIFFLDIESHEYLVLHQANDSVIHILKSIYPQKSDEDFWDNPRTAGLEFVTSGLNVDIVPVGKTNDPDYVAQPDKDSNVYFTSPTKQLEFISNRKLANTNYTTIVRILKKWRNVQDVKLSSFAIELIVAYLDINKGVQTDIQEAILRFFRLVSKREFPVLLFNAPYGTYQHDGSHVYIADPTHEENNVVKSVSDLEWNLVRIKADSAFETLLLAEEEEYITPTIDLWKEVFGSTLILIQLKTNMTQSEINKLHRSIATDFKLVTRKTELWTIPYCYEILHDVKKLMVFRYADSVSLIMNDHANTPIKVKKYKIGYTSRTQDDRPGGIDWEDGEGQTLTVVIMYTQDYHNLSQDQKIAFQRDNLKIPWGPSYVDTNFPHLSQSLSKLYTHSTAGVDRIDFN